MRSRYPALLAAALAVVACSAPPNMRSESHAVVSGQTLTPELRTAVEFLLGAAASDFHTHRAVEATRFRSGRLGRVANPDGTDRCILCGQFLPANEADW